MKPDTLQTIALLVAMLVLPVSSLEAAAPAVQDYQGVKYLTGGVGQDERDLLRSMAGQFNLSLMFAVQGGAFLSNVHVLIQDGGKNTVLDAVANGPYLYAELPPGSYTVTASLEGQVRSRPVTVANGRLARANFFWQ